MSEIEEQLAGINEEPSLHKLDKKLTVALTYLTRHENDICKLKEEKEGLLKWIVGGFFTTIGAFIYSIFIAKHGG